MKSLTDEINDYIKMIETDVSNILTECGKLSVNEAQQRFSVAPNPGGDPGDTHVSSDIAKNELTVKAEGEEILFIEFGTGVRFQGWTHPEMASHGFFRGGYGQHQGLNKKGWFYPIENGNHGGIYTEVSTTRKNSYHTYGQPASMPMYEARTMIENEWENIVKGVVR